MRHPGTIEIVDGPTGRVIRTEQADDVPESVAFANDEDGESQPVTRIVITEAGNRREIRSYGVDGGFLSATYQVAE